MWGDRVGCGKRGEWGKRGKRRKWGKRGEWGKGTKFVRKIAWATQGGLIDMILGQLNGIVINREKINNLKVA